MAEAQRAAHFRLRSWRRVEPPAWPFVWRGLLPVLGLLAIALFALTRFAHGWIEEAVAARTRAALDGAGLSWVQLEVSGQQVRLSGTAPSAADGDRALEVARQARCPSWAGELACAASVDGSFGSPPAEPPGDPAPAAEREAAAACEGGPGALLGQSTVEFASGSAVLAGSSGALQVAGWEPADVSYVDGRLEVFKGRIVRDRWVAQARQLAGLPTSARPPAQELPAT